MAKQPKVVPQWEQELQALGHGDLADWFRGVLNEAGDYIVDQLGSSHIALLGLIKNYLSRYVVQTPEGTEGEENIEDTFAARLQALILELEI